MSHRVYLYNINHPGEASEEDVMMMEWGYEIPLFLQPLLVEGGIISGNNYNTHTPGSNSGLFYNAPAGIENFKRFYNFIEKYQDELVEDTGKFKIAKENLFKYIDGLDQPYFNLDAWDVFNMNSTSHQEQAEEWLEDIRYNNAVINHAIDADDISLLKLSLFTKEVRSGFDDFKSLFNYSGYDYGWEVIDHPEPAQVQIFEENNLWGLKDKKGEILIIPKYHEFYAFNDDGIAVVSVDGQYGYVNEAGIEIIKPQFDNAFDFIGDCATVVKSEKYGQVNKLGKVIIDFIYQDMETINYDGGYYTGKLNEKWGAVDINNKVLIPFEYDEPVAAGNYGDTYVVPVKGKKTKLIFTNQFAFLIECENHFVKAILVPGERYIYEVVKNRKTEKNLLFDDQGQLLLSGYEKIANNLFYVFVIRKDKKYGLVNYRGDVILDFEYERIDQLHVVLNEQDRDFCTKMAAESEHLHDTFFKTKKTQKCGLYLSINNFNKRIADFIYDDIVSLNNSFLAVKKDGLWGLIHALGELQVPIEYDLILKGTDAYCCKGDMVYSFNSNVLVEADKITLQYYIDSNKELGYYYFNAEIANRLQAYVDKDLPPDELFYQKALALLDRENEAGLDGAVHYFHQAVDLGHAEAMNELAIIYEDAKGENPSYKDESQSFQLFLRSAHSGSKTAMLNVGFCYADGMGTSVDRQQMLYWYTEAFHSGNMGAAIELGRYYYHGEDGIENYELALKYYLKAEEMGNSVELELGWLYNYFDQPAKAMPYLLKAVVDDDQGYASWQLGFYAEHGVEMKVNLPLAIKRYKASADLNDKEAFLSLYRIYAHHKDFKDGILAKEYAQKAKSAGLEIEEETLLVKFLKLFKNKK